MGIGHGASSSLRWSYELPPPGLRFIMSGIPVRRLRRHRCSLHIARILDIWHATRCKYCYYRSPRHMSGSFRFLTSLIFLCELKHRGGSLPSRSLREDITGRSGHRPPGLHGRHNRALVDLDLFLCSFTTDPNVTTDKTGDLTNSLIYHTV